MTALTPTRDRFYFGAGPAMLPQPVLEQAQAELLSLQQSGISPLEIGHRSSAFMQIVEQSEQHLRQLLAIPQHYRLIFMTGGATSQFSLIPMNLNAKHAAYVVSGHWSKKAAHEASSICQVDVIANSESQAFKQIPLRETWQALNAHDYCYITDNETINGVEFFTPPETGEVPLIADMTSSLLTKQINVADYGVIFAATQKNLGTAGLCLLIIREDLVQTNSELPALWRYPDQLAMQSVMNTPPVYSWYLTELVLKWNLQQGGTEYFARLNQQKSSRLYEAIDSSDFYHNDIATDCRSRVNVSFRLADESLDEAFLQAAETAGLSGLKGHRQVGGMRASLYNAMPMVAVQRLVEFMQDFERRHG